MSDPKPFTDEDLKRLKESENAIQRSLGIPALLARLNAAEKVANRHTPAGYDEEDMADWNAWLKSCGEAGK